MEEPMAIARLARISVRAGFRNRLSEENIIPQKPRPAEVRGGGWTLRTPSATVHAVLLSVEPANSWIVGQPEVIPFRPSRGPPARQKNS
jgi:hypothetical protein